MAKKIVALLPLKANSERIPGKNFKPLAGKPLVQWILDALLSVDSIDQVVINTDARAELADIGVIDTDKVLIRDRKQHLCGDEVSMNLVLADDVENIEADLYLMTHTTNPLLGAETIKDAIQRLGESGDSDSLFTVNRFQTRFYTGDGEPINHDPDNLIRTQDLEPWYEENSCLYLFTADSFRRTNARIGEKPLMYETPPLESMDIDEPYQWLLTEALAEKTVGRQS